MKIFGYQLCDEEPAAVAARVCALIGTQGQPQSFVFLNPHSIALAESDPELRTSFERCTGAFCDGIGLWLACLLHGRRVRRVRGYEFFEALSHEMSRKNRGKVFFLGGQPESLQIICAKYVKEFPGIQQVVGYSPPFKGEFTESDIQDMAARIRESGSDVVWIGLGSPKQEKVLARLRRYSDVSVVAAVGAVFDFYAGTVSQAPRLVRVAGMEWIYRLIREPRRLWRRTFVSAPQFLLLVAKNLLGRS